MCVAVRGPGRWDEAGLGTAASQTPEHAEKRPGLTP